MTTKSQKIADDVVALLRARNPLLWIVTGEEARVERYLFEAAGAAGYVPRTWDVGQGVADVSGRVDQSLGGPDPGQTMSMIRDRATNDSGTAERGLWVMRDLPVWLPGLTGASTLRQLRNLARLLPSVPRDQAQAVVVISPSGDVPPELAGHVTVIEWPLPDRQEVADILDASIDNLPDNLKKSAAPNGVRESAIDAAIGLSGEEVASCYAKSLVLLKKIDPAAVAREKKRVIARERVLEWYDPLPGGLDDVGGLDNLKGWLVSRKTAFSKKARDYGLPPPRGCLLVGVPGCGKSLTAKAVSTAWSCPLLRLDLGALRSKFVGESEGNLRRALRAVEAIGRCVLWLDEIEKGLQGATSGSADGGVSADALGTILSWMQERPGEAFIIATANDVEGLPPELMRKGRFDEIWWVDLPNKLERAEVLLATLRQFKRDAKKIDIGKVAEETQDFTGSEIAALVPDAMYRAFSDGAREVTTSDLVGIAKSTVTLARTAAEKIGRLRKWADGRAKPASAVRSSLKTPTGGRVVDL